MRLPSGQYFGTTVRQVEFEGVRFSATDYEPFQQQPWHTHERTTLFAHVAGEQVDSGHYVEWAVPVLGVIYHPSWTRHQSRLGPAGARGVNVEISNEWL